MADANGIGDGSRIIDGTPSDALERLRQLVGCVLQSDTTRGETCETASELISRSRPERATRLGPRARKRPALTSVERSDLFVMACESGRRRDDLRNRPIVSLQRVEQRLVVRVHCAKAVAQEVELVLHANGGCIEAAVLTEWSRRRGAARKQTSAG